MSSTSTSRQLPPEHWVHRLFGRFVALYGAPKMQAMWDVQGAPGQPAMVTLAEVKALWAEQLERFPTDAIRKGMQALIDQGREWPPTLPEFKALCRQFRDPSHSPAALPAPGGTIDPEVGRRALAALRVVGKRDAA